MIEQQILIAKNYGGAFCLSFEPVKGESEAVSRPNKNHPLLGKIYQLRFRSREEIESFTKGRDSLIESENTRRLLVYVQAALADDRVRLAEINLRAKYENQTARELARLECVRLEVPAASLRRDDHPFFNITDVSTMLVPSFEGETIDQHRARLKHFARNPDIVLCQKAMNSMNRTDYLTTTPPSIM